MADTIIACSEGPTESEPALTFATTLAQTLEARLRLLWAWEGLPELESMAGDTLAGQVRERESGDRRAHLGALGAHYGDPAGVGWTVETPLGDPAEVIHPAAEAPGVRVSVEDVLGRA